jgi:hypothetical protein
MKKILMLMLIALLSITLLVACGDACEDTVDDTTADSVSETVAPPGTDTTTETNTPPTQAEIDAAARALILEAIEKTEGADVKSYSSVIDTILRITIGEDTLMEIELSITATEDEDGNIKLEAGDATLYIIDGVVYLVNGEELLKADITEEELAELLEDFIPEDADLANEELLEAFSKFTTVTIDGAKTISSEEFDAEKLAEFLELDDVVIFKATITFGICKDGFVTLFELSIEAKEVLEEGEICEACEACDDDDCTDDEKCDECADCEDCTDDVVGTVVIIVTVTYTDINDVDEITVPEGEFVDADLDDILEAFEDALYPDCEDDCDCWLCETDAA